MLRSAVAAALLALNTPPTPVDYQVCGTVHNGPVARPDGYGIPYQRKADLA